MVVKCILCNRAKEDKDFKGKMIICIDCETKGKRLHPKDYLVQLVYEIVNKWGIKDVETDLGVIDFSEISAYEFKKAYTKPQIQDISDILLELEDEFLFVDEEVSPSSETLVLDPLEIIEKYQNAVLERDIQVEIKDEPWRKHIPKHVKLNMKNWKNATLEEVYDTGKELMSKSTGAIRNQLFEFVCDLSELVFVEQQDEEETEDLLTGDAAEAIMNLVEMIILPHLEVLDKIKENGGNVRLADIWNQPFNDSLKKEVKDRDHWKCVICEDDKGLHVHHRIPRKLGGVNHKNNLVTLCSSCHPAIETANVQKAFKKCLANFRRNKNKGIKNSHASKDKTLLKDEVENILEKVLLSLGNKDENDLAKEITEVMDRLEIIFYE
ncbi:HNH endonuclease [Bacillus sp. MUM 13]|uniref:HNH endonuclease n=1 Tax=Bacillus sp. MUM 13 TaxID=1678001 RepID=UPI0008F5C368|nr:HNH endonuclease [Bacillus sp. MUM 13]OIK11319.1 hypothetical protein BIV59_12635 [Bacillus sp. MUM 13]